MEEIRVVVNGAGSAGVAIVKLLLHMGVNDVILCDTKGIIYKERKTGMNPFKQEMAHITNKEQKQGSLADALTGADVFVGVSAAGAVTKDMVRSMNQQSNNLCNGKSNTGNYAGGCKGSGSHCCWNRPF